MPLSPRHLPLATAAALSILALDAGHGAQAAQTRDFPSYALEPGAKPGRVTVEAKGQPGARQFRLTSTAPQRDNTSNLREISERGPYTVTGDLLFDALFAQSVDDAALASVSSIKDGAYNGGQPIACNCFETGEKWNYVWTRDLSYALDLGLAGLDPQRAVDSLLFKTGSFRAGVSIPAELPNGSTQIVQDTGSGGSWPISTDRTSWALGAEAVLANLRGGARADFARKAYDALRGTVEADRIAAFDTASGLYGGEHSFLDWREQTYARWVREHLPAMAQSKALSTNVLQYRALRLASRLAREVGDVPVATRYDGWAEELSKAIDATFWDARAGMYATYTMAEPTPARIEKYDLLGNALVVLSGVAPPERARSIFDRYPFAPFGPSVVWPQAPGEFVYHNRAQWPFVTAYGLRAAIAAGHVAAVDQSLAALERAAALHLSNMENLEWLTGRAQFDDGPEINSRRQLWSVGAYYGAIVQDVFGWQPGADGVHIRPYLTTATRARFDKPEVVLGGLSFAGKPVEIALILPAKAATGGAYPVAGITLNGKTVNGPLTSDEFTASRNRIEVRFGPAQASQSRVTALAPIDPVSHKEPRAFMPWTPGISGARRTAEQVALDFGPTKDRTPLRYRVLRDGVLVADDVTGSGWTDTAPPPPAVTACYSIVAVHVSTRIASQPSAPVCLRGEAAQTIAVGKMARLGQTLDLGQVMVASGGRHALTTTYENRTYAVNTGITNAVKRLVLVDEAGKRYSAILQMPHIDPEGDRHSTRSSTRAIFDLPAGRYSVSIEDFFNMSALSTNASYSGPGGMTGPVNEARIETLMVDRLP
ncbi:MAG: hypothetical protein JHC88_01785 [Niveispirillum sp.]|nr:hypothetical protein [Niveispirillum sp.]